MSKIGDIAIGFVIGVGSVLGLGFWLDKKEKDKTVNSANSTDIEAETLNDETTSEDSVKSNSTGSEDTDAKCDFE